MAQHRKSDSDAALAKAVQQNADNWAAPIAVVHAFRGESDKSLKWSLRFRTDGSDAPSAVVASECTADMPSATRRSEGSHSTTTPGECRAAYPRSCPVDFPFTV